MEVYTNINPDRPLWEQYVDYIVQILSGDFGRSFFYNEPVAKLLAEALPWTLFLMSFSIALTFGIGVVLGALMAYSEGSRFDIVWSVGSVILNSIPYYVAAIVLVFILGYQWEIFPTDGRMNHSVTPGVKWPFIKSIFYHAALPIFSFVITGFGGWALSMRGNSISVIGEDFVRSARIRGVPSNQIALKYVGKNAVLPMYTGLLIAIGFMFGGAVVLETIFEYTGVGYYMFQALNARDYPLIMGGFIVITTAVVIGVLFADLTYHRIDPRAGGEFYDTE
jgi:peptide/nickel transport system permease protein